MNITVDDIFKYSFIISIDNNKFNSIISIFKKNLLIGLKQFNGFTDYDLTGKKKCGLSHIGIIKLAQALDLPYVCIFEDDAYPCINVKEKINLELKKLSSDADVLLLGWCNEISQFNNILTGQCNGSHAYIVFKSGYSLFNKCYNLIPDKHIDRIFFEMAKHDGHIYCSSENLFIQYSPLISMNKHLGYIYNGKDNKNPPVNYLTLSQQIFKSNIDNQKLTNFIINNFKIINKYKTNEKCILIGNNLNKIKRINARKYIDLTDYFKVRINHLSDKTFISNYGKRTDLFLCESKYSHQISVKHKKYLEIDANTIKYFSDIFLISYAFNLSIDFISAVILSYYFNTVELFGINLNDDEIQILKKFFNNISIIEDNHPELIPCRHGISNSYYKNKNLIPQVLKKLNLQSVQDILSINKNACISNKCIIIGGAETVKIGAFGNYINTCNKTIIRINTAFTPDGYDKFIGNRTDLIIASSYHSNHDIIHKLQHDADISLYLTNDIRKMMQVGKSPLTTGFMTLLLCLYLFDEIELLGFGLTNVTQQNGICESFHNIEPNKIQLNCKHNINYEHQYIDKLIKNPIYKISRIEETKLQYLN